MRQMNVAVVGATGAVGTKIIEKLIERKFPIKSLKLLASKRSAGSTIQINGEDYVVEETSETAFEGIDIAFFSAGGSITEHFAKHAIEAGALVIDNTSAFRMTEGVPLVVPEVNPDAIREHNGLIANPNCSTIQMVAALKGVKDQFGINRLIVSTYQAVSGAGADAIEELKQQSENFENRVDNKADILPSGSAEKHYPIAFNVLPQIDLFGEGDYTLEELKMMNETRKIFDDYEMSVAATCVRLPVVTGHSESVYIELDRDDVTVDQLKEAIRSVPNVVLQDDPSQQLYPMPLFAEGTDEVFVGRVRKDRDKKNGFHLWIVADNLIKGAALNSVQIAETYLEQQ
ncbi:aspartate-semialdehyde dehydrogenase [Planococcaceae bacterium Storch 2/2-2]|nr:aspartate-semialdehyde dehydrogenase [Planococcaceae bacterium Storch 2/2-2]